MRAHNARAAQVVAQVQRGVRGAPAKLERLGRETGVTGDSATSVLPTHDQVQQNPLDHMHTGAVSAERLLNAVSGHLDRADKLEKNLSKEVAAEAVREAVAAAPPHVGQKRPGAAAHASGREGGGAKATQRKSGADTWYYTSVVGHEDDAFGERSKYRVAWPGGAVTEEPADVFSTDALRSEGPFNAVTLYELGLLRGVPQAVDLHRRMQLNRPLRHQHNIIAESLGQSRALRLPNNALAEMDSSLWQLPYNSEVMPWRGSQPLTHPARMQMSDQHAWITSGNAEFQFRGRWGPNVNRIIRRWLRACTAIEAPVITQRICEAMGHELTEAAAEIELVMPATDHSLLFSHAPCHFPEQLAHLGPVDTHNMWGFEGFVCPCSMLHTRRCVPRAGSGVSPGDSSSRRKSPKRTLPMWCACFRTHVCCVGTTSRETARYRAKPRDVVRYRAKSRDFARYRTTPRGFARYRVEPRNQCPKLSRRYS